jgi:hypothetical protein
MKMDADEKELLESVERWRMEVCQGWQARPRSVLPKRAPAEGLPYQTLISSLRHKYASGRLKKGIGAPAPRSGGGSRTGRSVANDCALRWRV